MGNIADNIAWLIMDGFDYWWSCTKGVFNDFTDMISTQSVALIQTTITSCGLDSSGMWTTEFLNKLNFFFPVNETLVILNVLFLFWLSVLGVKITLKLIPGVY